MFISPVALQILLGAQCGHISTTVNISHCKTENRIHQTRQLTNVAMCYLALPFTSQYFIQTPIAMIISKKEHACDLHVLRKGQGYFRI